MIICGRPLTLPLTRNDKGKTLGGPVGLHNNNDRGGEEQNVRDLA